MRDEFLETETSQQSRLATLPLGKLFPNMLTLLGLCIGISSIRYALDEKWELAVTFIVIAAFVDGMDGRIARLLKATSNFGAQLDSLSDFVCFGLSPAFLLYLWQLHTIPLKRVAWALVLFYIVCCAIRLARFNASIDEDAPEWRGHFFTGIPITAGALLVLTPMMLSFDYEALYFLQSNFFLGCYISSIAVLMASRIPTFSFKKIAIRAEFASLVLVAAGAITTSVIIDPWTVIPLLAAAYICLIPISIISYIRMRNKFEK